MGPRQSKNGCCGDRPLSNLGAAIGIPCYFKPKSEGSNLSQNNMGSLWEPLNWTLVGHHNINFLIAQDLYKDNLKRKCILFAGLLKLKFWLLGRSTNISRRDQKDKKASVVRKKTMQNMFMLLEIFFMRGRP